MPTTHQGPYRATLRLLPEKWAIKKRPHQGQPTPECKTTVTTKKGRKAAGVSCRPSQEHQGPVHSPPSCPRACQLKYQVFDTPRTILPHKCKRRYLNPKGGGGRKASFFWPSPAQPKGPTKHLCKLHPQLPLEKNHT